MTVNPVTKITTSILYANTFVTCPVNRHDCILLMDFNLAVEPASDYALKYCNNNSLQSKEINGVYCYFR